MNLPKLYSRTSTGAIQTWQVEIDEFRYRTVSGQLDGKLVTTEWTICEGKNLGRSNQTSPSEQALKDAQSIWDKKKKSKGYWENITDVDKVTFTEPMLAKKFVDRLDTITYPVMVDRKYNGCLLGSSEISLKDGSTKTIQEIVEKKLQIEVKTYNTLFNTIENKIVTGWLKQDSHSECGWFIVELENGNNLTLTGNHRVWVKNLKCWRRVDELDGTEELLPLNLL